VDGVVSTFAGNGKRALVDGKSNEASFDGPAGICLNRLDNHLYVADSFNCAIRKISLDTGLVSTVSGNGESGTVDGAVTKARWSSPCGITTDQKGNIYVSDLNRIRKVDTKGQSSPLSYLSTSLTIHISHSTN
jgi:sugar lactone lactonase YvrE